MVKQLKGHTATFYKHDLPTLLANLEKNSLLLVAEDNGGIQQVPARMLQENPDAYQDYRFAHYDGQEGKGHNGNGEIYMKLSRRNPDSPYYRVPNVPMLDIALHPNGSYELRMSVDGSGMQSPFLILSPAL